MKTLREYVRSPLVRVCACMDVRVCAHVCVCARVNARRVKVAYVQGFTPTRMYTRACVHAQVVEALYSTARHDCSKQHSYSSA